MDDPWALLKEKSVITVDEVIETLISLDPQLPRHVARELTITAILGNLTENPPTQLSYSQILLFLERFGPAKTSLVTALRDLIDASGSAHSWFHGNISRAESHQLLLQPGFFLCRYSENPNASSNLIISTCTLNEKKKEIWKHHVVYRQGTGYRLGMSKGQPKKHKNLEEFINIHFPTHQPLPSLRWLNVNKFQNQSAFIFGLSDKYGKDSPVYVWSKNELFERRCIPLIFSYLWILAPSQTDYVSSFNKPKLLEINSGNNLNAIVQYHVEYPVVSSTPSLSRRLESKTEKGKAPLQDFFERLDSP